jgi:hypothetical protein
MHWREYAHSAMNTKDIFHRSGFPHLRDSFKLSAEKYYTPVLQM